MSPSDNLQLRCTGYVHSILSEDSVSWRVSAKFVPRLLMMEHKQLHLGVLQDMLDSINGNPDFLSTIITGGELWVMGMTPKQRHSHHSGDIQYLQGKKKIMASALQCESDVDCFL